MKKKVFLFIAIQLLFISMMLGQQNVKASYYADKFHGRKTASGSLYHRDSLTCAHKTLPFGTLLRVTNPKNNKEVIVKVTDRGPFIKGRTVDLSYAAAKNIGMVAHGVFNIQIERIDPAQLFEPKLANNRQTDSKFLLNLKKLEAPTDTINVRRDNTKVSDTNLRIAFYIKNPIIKTA